MNDLVLFNFHGARLEVTRGDTPADLWVSLRRVCEALGIDESSQRQKLKNKAWARTVLNTAPDDRGHAQLSLMVHIESLPMWLATIEPSRVADTARPKLELFQVECARALRDHFLGQPAPAQPVLATTASIGDSALARRDVAAYATFAAKARGVSIHRVHGAVRRAHHAPGIYQVPLAMLEHVKNLLQAFATGSILLPARRPATLRLLHGGKNPKQLELLK